MSMMGMLTYPDDFSKSSGLNQLWCWGGKSSPVQVLTIHASSDAQRHGEVDYIQVD